MKHKVFRALCALVLVFVLLVSWSPIRAQAVTQDVIVGVAIDKVGIYAQAGALSTGAAAFCYVAMALGIVWKAGQAIEAVSDYMEWSGELETSIYYYPDGTWSYGVDVGFVDRVRAFLYDRGYLVDTGNLATTVPEGATYRNYTANGPCVAFCYSYSYYVASKSEYYFSQSGYLVSTVPDFKISVNGKVPDGSITYNDNRYYYYCFYQGAKSFATKTQLSEFLAQPSDYYYVGDTGTTYSLTSVINKYGWSGVCGAGDTVIDYVAAPDVSIEVGYPEWYVNSRPALSPDTGEEVTVLPVPIVPSPDVQEFPDNLTQSEIWQGSIEAPPPGYGEDDDIDGDTQLGETPWENFKKWIEEGWDDITQSIPTADSIGGNIGNVIKSIFVPSPDFLQPKVAELKERFPFIDGIIDLGHYFADNLSSDLGPPVIYVDLGEATTDTFGHRKYLLTDFAWYAPYKPKVDALMSSVLWAFYGWRIFVRLPSIISGEGGQVAFLALSDLRRRENEYMESEKQRARGDRE